VRDISKPNRPPRRKLDTSRAQERFGFEATARFEEGMRAMIRWYEQVRRA
jgi:dTDP-glucose 4,6-dehydratase/GDP-L-fucose synthase